MAPVATSTIEAPAAASKLAAKASQSLGTLAGSTDAFDPATYGIDDKLSYATVSERLKKSCLSEFSIPEQKARIELAAAYRLFAKFDWNESVYNHLSCKIEEADGSHAFLINPYGLRYDEVTASSLLKIDYDGNLIHPGVVGDLFGVNKAGFVIHSAMHKARPDAVAVMHSHQALATGIACTKTGFIEALSQTSELLGPMTYHEYEGIVIDDEESVRIIASLGESNVMLMKNHGTVTLGETVAGAWYRMYVLIRACEIQLAAQTAAVGDRTTLVCPPDEVVQKTFEIAKSFSRMAMGRLEFAAYVRLMDKEDASFRL